jgi:N-hydroxyarylamine O-acetyltransferase
MARLRFDLTKYLERLGIDDPGEPSVRALRALHRAHVERVPYENLDIQLGRPTTVDQDDCVARVLRGRGGYCVQINLAFSALLTRLGYDITWHRAGVQGRGHPPLSGRAPAPHLVPVVRLEGGLWLADVGFGDALHEPVPLRPGVYRDGPMTYRIGPSQVDVGGWRFQHDPRGSIGGIDFGMSRADQQDFAEWHPYLVTAPESRLVRAAVVMRRDAAGADCLMGCMLRRIDGDGAAMRELPTEDSWFGTLAGVFGLPLTDLGQRERAALWAKVRTAHEVWLAARGRSVS